MAYCNGSAWIAMGAPGAASFGTLTTNDFCTAASGTAIQCTTGFTGNGNVVLATSPTLATPTMTGPTVSSGGLTITTGGLTVSAGGASIAGTVSGTTFSGSGASLTGIGTSNLTAVTGTPSATTFLAGNGQWATPSGSLPSLTSGDLWIGNTSNVATAVQATGDCTISNSGQIVCTKTNGTLFGTLATLSAAPAGTLTGTTLASNVTGSFLTGVGTITTGTWNGQGIGIAYGGTNSTSQTTNGVTYFDGTSIISGSGFVYSSGQVGIGTATPTGKLDINAIPGGLVVSGANLDPAQGYSLTPLENSGKLLVGWNRQAGNGEIDLISNRQAGNVGGFNLYDYTNSGTLTPLVTIQGGGNVGIGSTNPAATLDVNGTGNFTGVVNGVTPTSGPNLATKAYVDTAVASAGGSGAPVNFQVFTASGTWTKPGSGSMASVQCWGGGAGGHGGAGGETGGIGGGGGGYGYAWFALSSLTSSVTVTIGSGGSAGALGAAGGNGGNSTFGSYLTASGGNATGAGGAGSGTGVATSGGGYGGGAIIGVSGTTGYGGSGGGPGGGYGGSGGMNSGTNGETAGSAGSVPGGGGGGGGGAYSIGAAGGAGGAGECVVTVY